MNIDEKIIKATKFEDSNMLTEAMDEISLKISEAIYFAMANPYFEDLAVEEAKTRLMRLTKSELIRIFRSVMSVLVMFFDIKAAHDCLTSIVQELNERSAIFARKDEEINRLYEDLTGRNAEQFDAIVSRLPQRMWVE